MIISFGNSIGRMLILLSPVRDYFSKPIKIYRSVGFGFLGFHFYALHYLVQLGRNQDQLGGWAYGQTRTNWWGWEAIGKK